MLEIIAPKEIQEAGYLKKFSKNPQGNELLLDCYTEFEVIDAALDS
jgi:hypothetical protein